MSPTIAAPGSFRVVNPRQLGHLLNAAAVVLLLLSFIAKDSVAYLCVAVPVLLPAFFWFYFGAFGIPVLPVVAVLFYVYYALPLLVGNTLTTYKLSELVWATLSVGYFLTAATLAAWPFLGIPRDRLVPLDSQGSPRRTPSIKTGSLSDLASNDELYRLIYVGFAAGIVFYVAVISREIGYLGTFASVVRACVLPLTSVACYFSGFARGAGALRGQRWAMALGGFIAVTTLSLSSLFLVGGATNIAAIVLGYVLASNRIPWRTIALTIAVLVVLNGGKGNIRDMYWERDSQTVRNTSIVKVPALMVEWFVAGVSSIGSSPRANRPSLFERASLLHMVLAVQAATPTVIPYLDGETYTYLAAMLVPRFIKPDKIESQAVLNLLSVRYGRETQEGTVTTTIGWGMVAEAYANYGNAAVLIVGALFGAFCGMLMRLSTRASPLSLSMLIVVASTLTLCNVEADFSYLFVTLFQTVVGIGLFAALPRIVKRRAPLMRYVVRN